MPDATAGHEHQPQPQPQPDRARARAFAQRLMGIYGDAMLTNMIALGTLTGLTAALAEAPGTSAQVAERAGLHERYVREWLRGMVTGGIVEHDDGVYSLPAAHAVSLTGEAFLNTTAIAAMAAAAGGGLPRMAEVMRRGDGIPFDEQPGDMPLLMDALSRARYETFLVDSYLASVPGLPERLEAGIDVADVGCGTGRVVTLIAEAYPRSRVLGIDLAEGSIARARAEAAALGLANARFEAAPLEALEGPLDLVTAFDVIHDLGDPAGALAHIRGVLEEDGLLVMCDSAAPADLEEQATLPWAPMMYGLSLFGCVGTARSQGGEGLGNMWGEAAARALLAGAGFTDVQALPAKGDPMNALYVARPAQG